MAKPKKTSRKSPKKKPAAKKAPAKKKVIAKRAPAKKKVAPKKAPAKKAKAAPKKAAPKKAAPKKAAPTKTAIAKKAAKQAARSVVHEPRAFIEGKITTDALAEELAEDSVRAMTSGEDEEGDRDGERVAEKGGPFVVSSGSVEYADDEESPNIASAERAGTPTTRDESDDDEG